MCRMNEVTIDTFHSISFCLLKSPPSCPSPSSLFFFACVYVWLSWSLLLPRVAPAAGSGGCPRVGARTSPGGGVSWAAQAVGSRVSSCGPRAWLTGGMWNLPAPGIEPLSPALAGRSLTTRPTGKPHFIEFLTFLLKKTNVSNTTSH